MKIIVFGASGATGHPLVEAALGAGHSVTAFVRTPAKLRIQHAKLHVTQGDVGDTDAVGRAVAGHDAVLSTLGVGKPLAHDPVVIDGVGHILRAMQDTGVRRLVYLGFTGVRKDGLAGLLIRPIVEFLLRHEIGDHVVKERLIRESPLDWTIVHAPKLTNGRATGRYRTGVDLEPHSIFPLIAREDVAAAMIATLTDDESVRRIIDVQPR
jgi:putative NADH-flavin reductase